MTTNKRMVELDAVDEMINKIGILTYTQKVVLIGNLAKLPSIPNPMRSIEEMIKDRDTTPTGLRDDYMQGRYDALIELLSKLKS